MIARRRVTLARAELRFEIQEYQAVLGSPSEHDPQRPVLLNNLAIRLRALALLDGDHRYRDAAIQVCRELTDKMEFDARERPTYFNTLGNCLADRFTDVGSSADLDEAIAAYQAAVDCASRQGLNDPAFAANLASALADRHRRDGNIADLDEAIEVVKQIWHTGMPDPAEQSGLATNYLSLLQDHYAATGTLADLDLAVAVAVSGLRQPHEDAETTALLRSNLGGILLSRHEHTHDPADLDVALQELTTALADTPTRVTRRAIVFNNLGIALATRARAGSGRQRHRDITRAIRMHRRAVAAAGRIDRPQYLNSLGAALLDRYQWLGRRRDLRKALRAWQRSVAATPVDAPLYARRLGNLARGYALRHTHSGRRRDVVRATRSYRDGCLAGLRSDPESTLLTGTDWGTWAIQRDAFPEAAEAYAFGCGSFAGQLLPWSWLWAVTVDI